MITVNCSAIPEALFESEVFGHARGVFTGAQRDKPGRFELASGGTLFIDEIGKLPLPMQAKFDEPAAAPKVLAAPLSQETSLLTRSDLRARERASLAAALAQTGGKIFGSDRAAALLGIKPTTLASRIKVLGLKRK